jgi:hypothetical protein
MHISSPTLASTKQEKQQENVQKFVVDAIARLT